jgi:hypothetical protein
MTITRDGFTRLRKSADTDKLVLDWNHLAIAIEDQRTHIMFLQDGVVVATRDAKYMCTGDRLDLTGLRGQLELEVTQT